MAEARMVEVTVAKRRSLQTRLAKGAPSIVHRPGSKVMVPEAELERLHKQGFIVDPHEKKLTQEQIEAASLDHAIGGDTLSITEKSDQSIKPTGKAARNAA